MKESRQQKSIKQYALYIGLIVLGISSFNLLKHTKFTDWYSILGIVVSTIALLPSWRSNKLTEESVQEAREKAIQEQINTIRKENETRDREQGRIIAELAESLAKVRAEIEVKRISYSNLLDKMSAMEKDLAMQTAYLEYAVQMSDIRRQVQNVQHDISLMKGNCHVLR